MSRGLIALLLLAGVAHADDAPAGHYTARDGKRQPPYATRTPGGYLPSCGAVADLALAKLQVISIDYRSRTSCRVNGVAWTYRGAASSGGVTFESADPRLSVTISRQDDQAFVGVFYVDHTRGCGDGVGFIGTYTR